MNLLSILTEEEIKDCKRQEGILGSPNYDVIMYNLEKHIMELDTGNMIELIKAHYLSEIKDQLEAIFYQNEE